MSADFYSFDFFGKKMKRAVKAGLAQKTKARVEKKIHKKKLFIKTNFTFASQIPQNRSRNKKNQKGVDPLNR